MIKLLRNHFCLLILLVTIVLIIAPFFPKTSSAQTTAYVTDQCEITFRRGPGRDYKILRLLKSGEAVQMIQETEEGWAQITLEDGSQGYVLKRYITFEEPMSRRAVSLMEKNQELEAESLRIKEENKRLQTENDAFQQQLDQSQQQAGDVEQELRQLKLDAQNVVALKKELSDLKKKHVDLEEKYRQARIENEQKEDRHLWLIFGAGILLFGLIIGALSRRQSSRYGRPRLQ